MGITLSLPHMSGPEYTALEALPLELIYADTRPLSGVSQYDLYSNQSTRNHPPASNLIHARHFTDPMSLHHPSPSLNVEEPCELSHLKSPMCIGEMSKSQSCGWILAVEIVDKRLLRSH